MQSSFILNTDCIGLDLLIVNKFMPRINIIRNSKTVRRVGPLLFVGERMRKIKMKSAESCNTSTNVSTLCEIQIKHQ